MRSNEGFSEDVSRKARWFYETRGKQSGAEANRRWHEALAHVEVLRSLRDRTKVSRKTFPVRRVGFTRPVESSRARKPTGAGMRLLPTWRCFELHAWPIATPVANP